MDESLAQNCSAFRLTGIARPKTRVSGRLVTPCLIVWSCASFGATVAYAVTDHRDTLDRALSVSDDSGLLLEDPFAVLVSDHESYDNNLFRLPSNVLDVEKIVGPGASREDHINSASAAADAQWSIGRQIVTLDLDATDNRFARNTDLDNVSTNDKVVWNWEIGPQLSGEVGADYTKFLPDFVNTTYHHRDLYQRSEFFGTARYQVGPHWGVFGGVLDFDTSLDAGVAQSNDAHSKSVEFGFDYATDLKNSIGGDYRRTDTRFPNTSLLDDVSIAPDFHEDSEQFLIKYSPSDKTTIDASGGYLKRAYPSGAIGSFSGDIWRVAVQWQPTDKLQLAAEGWRQLQAYLTAQTDYFVSKGVSLSPSWSVSEKVTVALEASWNNENYVGTSTSENPILARRDTLTAERLIVNYKPTRVITVDLSVGESRRASDFTNFNFNDRIISAGLTAKFR